MGYHDVADPARHFRNRALIVAASVAVVVGGMVLFRVARSSDPSKGEAMVARYGELTDKMCGCADKACADKISDLVNKWSAEAPSDTGDQPLDDKLMTKWRDLMERYTSCQMKLATP